MNSKTLNLFVASVLAVVLLANLMSALTLVSNPTTASFTQSSLTNNFTITNSANDGAFSITSHDSTVTITDKSSNTIIFNINPTTGLTNTNSAKFNIVTTEPSKFNLGKYTGTIKIIAQNGTNSSLTNTLNIPINYEQTFCKYGEKGDLALDVNIDHISGFGTKDDEWYPEDEIKLSVNVDNQGDDKIQDITIAWGLYNPKTGKWVIDDEESTFDLKSGKDITKEITFKVNADDLDSNTEDYILYVKAYSDDVGEDNQCVSDSQDTLISIDSDFVILTNVKLNPTLASCGSEVQLTGDVWNVGSDDQDDVYVRLYSPELKIDQKVTIGTIDSLDNKKLNVNIQIPEGLTEKTYDLQLEVYDENDDLFINDNDDESRDIFSFKVEGCAFTPKALITADIQSGGQSGKDLVIKSTIKNIGTTSSTYTISATGYESWATLSGVQPATITLNANEQRDVLITLNVNDDISGDQTFNIVTATGTTDKEKLTQPVAVTIQKSGFSLPGISGFAVSNNWYLWGIGILNVILVIIIIVVAMRIARS